MIANVSNLEFVCAALTEVKEFIDEVMLHRDPYEAAEALKEVQQKIKLIDLAFGPLFKEMKVSADQLDQYASKLIKCK